MLMEILTVSNNSYFQIIINTILQLELMLQMSTYWGKYVFANNQLIAAGYSLTLD